MIHCQRRMNQMVQNGTRSPVVLSARSMQLVSVMCSFLPDQRTLCSLTETTSMVFNFLKSLPWPQGQSLHCINGNVPPQMCSVFVTERIAEIHSFQKESQLAVLMIGSRLSLLSPLCNHVDISEQLSRQDL